MHPDGSSAPSWSGVAGEGAVYPWDRHGAGVCTAPGRAAAPMLDQEVLSKGWEPAGQREGGARTVPEEAQAAGSLPSSAARAAAALSRLRTRAQLRFPGGIRLAPFCPFFPLHRISSSH